MSTTLAIGDIAPNFRGSSTKGEIDFHDYIDGHWTLFTTHPTPFTPVCSTELIAEARVLPELQRREIKAVTLASGNQAEHARWAKDIASVTGSELHLPILDDEDWAIADLYGLAYSILDGRRNLFRTAIVIDPDKVVRWVVTYPRRTGRNFAEIIRVIDSQRLIDSDDIYTPADWTPGDRVLVPGNLEDDLVGERYGEYDKLLDYLRLVDAPEAATAATGATAATAATR